MRIATILLAVSTLALGAGAALAQTSGPGSTGSMGNSGMGNSGMSNAGMGSPGSVGGTTGGAGVTGSTGSVGGVGPGTGAARNPNAAPLPSTGGGIRSGGAPAGALPR